MESSLRILHLFQVRNYVSAKSMRNYGLYFAVMLFLIYFIAKTGGRADFLLLTTMGLAITFCAERHFFPQVKDTMNSIHYLTLPANKYEKWFVEFIYSLIIIPAIALSPIVLAILVVKLTFAFSGNLHVNPDSWIRALKIYWYLHPLLFFGAIYFRHSILVKTFGSIALLAIASALYMGLLAKLFDNAFSHYVISFADANDFTFFNLSGIHSFLTILYFGFFWVMSYLAFIEVEN